MELGCFSVSLAVRDLAKSKEFYAKLGFQAMGGDEAQGWLILKNGSTNIGLFQGMFEGNILTFNPGWDQNAQAVDQFTDIRDIQKRLKAAGMAFDTETDEASTGPAHFIIKDPDGNTVMLDQHR